MLFIYFRQRQRVGEREGEKHQGCLSPAPYWGPDPQPGIDWELNQRQFGSQASAQCTEPHQPELILIS